MADIASLTRPAVNLSLRLREFAALVPLATQDVNNLARNVNLLAFELKHVEPRLRREQSMFSREAEDAVSEIVRQGHAILSKIEILVLSKKRAMDAGNTQPPTLEEGFDWNDSVQRGVQYFSAYLDALRITLSVMLQVHYTAKAVVQSTRSYAYVSQDAITTERMQLESLVLDQHIALNTVAKLYEEYQQSNSREGSMQQIRQNPFSQALMVTENLSLGPELLTEVLIPLHISGSSSALQLPPTEHERFALVRQFSPEHIDHLIERWIVPRESEKELDDRLLRQSEKELDARANESRRRKQRELDERRRSQQPRVESDDESSEDEAPRVVSPGISSARWAPSAPPVNPIRYEIPPAGTRPVPVSTQNLRPPGPIPPSSPQSFGSPRSPSYIPVSPTGSLRSAGYSPASPRSSFSDGISSRSVPGPKTKRSTKNGLRIPWRLCVPSPAGVHYWDLIDEKVVGSNTPMEHSMAQSDRNAWTEVAASWVTKEALDQAGYEYLQFQRDSGDSHRTQLETCFRIYRPLTSPEVERLVERSAEIYRRNSQARLPPPPLDRSQTSPLPSYPSHLDPTTAYYSSRVNPYKPRTHATRSNASNTSDSDTPSRARSRRSSASSKRKHRDKHSDGSRLGKLASIGGIAVLIDGLADGLGAF